MAEVVPALTPPDVSMMVNVTPSRWSGCNRASTSLAA
jgi:hypothetical protein